MVGYGVQYVLRRNYMNGFRPLPLGGKIMGSLKNDLPSTIYARYKDHITQLLIFQI